MTSLTKAKNLASEAAREAGKILMRSYRKKLSYRRKGPIEFVSEVDLRSEKKIVSMIRKEFPEHGIFSEESGMIKKADYLWYIDPLDGTHNYIHGVTPFGVSIALTKAKESLLGVIYIPMTDELYVGVKGKGATLNGKRIKVSKRSKEEAMINLGTRIRERTAYKIAMLKRFAYEFEMVRAPGAICQSLAWLASGNVDIVITYTLPAYDTAAGYCIAKEAGAKITDFKGKPVKFDNKEFLMTNGRLHAHALKLTRSSK